MHQIRFLQVVNFYTWNSLVGHFYNLIPCSPPHIFFPGLFLLLFSRQQRRQSPGTLNHQRTQEWEKEREGRLMSMDRWMQTVSFLSSWIDSHPGLTLILDWHSSWIDPQGGRDPYLTVASMDSALSHSLASEDSDNDLLEQRWPVTESWKEPLIFQQWKVCWDYAAFCTMHVRLKRGRSCTIIAALLHLTSEDWDYAGVRRTDRIKWQDWCKHYSWGGDNQEYQGSRQL